MIDRCAEDQRRGLTEDTHITRDRCPGGGESSGQRMSELTNSPLRFGQDRSPLLSAVEAERGEQSTHSPWGSNVLPTLSGSVLHKSEYA